MRLRSCAIPAGRQGNDVSTAGWAFTDIPAIEQLNDGRRIKVLQPGNIFLTAKQVAAQCNLLVFIPGRKQAVMPNPHKTLWGYMHQKSPDEFLPGKSEFLPLSMVFVILNGKRNRGISDTLYAVVAYGNPVGIFAKISDDGLCTMKWLLTIRDPFFGIAGVQKLFKSIMIFVRFRRSMELQLSIRP